MPEQRPLEIDVTAPPAECEAKQASDSQILPGGTGPSTCEAATGLLVWPRDCTEAGENTRIEEMLRKIDPNTLTSTDPLCHSNPIQIPTANEESHRNKRDGLDR